MSSPSTVKLKIASANLNQKIANFTRNVPLIEAAIDAAVEDGANVLSLQELGLTGYAGDDYFSWIRNEHQQQEILELVKHIADYAKTKDPNLVISLGFPLFYTDKSQDVRINLGTDENPAFVPNPLYNINDRPFNAQALIQNGEMHSVSLKTIQPDGAAEYEPRQFTSWPDYLPVQTIDLPFFGKVKAGNVVTQLKGKEGQLANLYHEVCADAWPGLRDDGTINDKEVQEGRHLSRIAQEHDISLVINPSASKPEPYLDKVSLREKLAHLGSNICGGAGYIYTNCLGLEAVPSAFEGGSIFVENGQTTHSSRRYSMADVEYSSRVMALPAVHRGTPDVVIEDYDFTIKGPTQQSGGPAPFEDITEPFERQTEETVRNTALWIRDYLRETGLQGFIISLSGGADSAFGAVMISQAIDLNIAQLTQMNDGDEKQAVADFINQFSHLAYRQEVLDTLDSEGTQAAIALMKRNMLTCIYLPSDNSGVTTQDAAQCLIEGGQLCKVRNTKTGVKTSVVFNEANGDRIEGDTLFKREINGKDDKEYQLLDGPTAVSGIGGKFEIVNVQASVDSLIEAFAGVVHRDLAGQTIEYPEGSGQQVSLLERVKHEIREYVGGKIGEDGKIIKASNGEPDYRLEFSSEVDAAINQKDPERRLSWRNSKDDVTLQNIQARARQPYPWMFGNKEHKIACVTSNWSEAVAGYWTFGGDGHMGAINLCGGVPKSKLKKMLRYLEEKGLDGMPSVDALHTVNVQIPTAELRPDEQSDEADMMPYKMLDAIGEALFFYKCAPAEVYEQLHKMPDPDDPNRLLFAKHDDPNQVDKEYLIHCIEQTCRMWHRSQFKRVGSVASVFLGQNVDPHTSVRTTILSDGFKTNMAQLRLKYLQEKYGNDFTQKTGQDFDELNLRSKINADVREAVLEAPLEKLPDALQALDLRHSARMSIAVGGTSR